MDCFIRLSFLTGGERIKEKASSWIKEVIDAQKNDPEGYIGLYPYHDTIIGRWDDVVVELWPQSRAYLPMLAYYEATGDQQVLDAVIRAARKTIAHFQPGHEGLQPERADHTNTHALLIVGPMIQLYGINGNNEYLDFYEFIYDKLEYHNKLPLDGSLYLLEVPSDPVGYKEAAPGFPYRKYVMKEDAAWNSALEPVYNQGKKHHWHASIPFDDINTERSFTIEKLEIPEGSLPWEYPHLRIKCRARVYTLWKYDPPVDQLDSKQEYLLRQLPPPYSAVYFSLLKQAEARAISLVPFGTTRLRITCFPYIMK